MAEIVSKGQASTGRLIEVVMVAFAAAAFVLVIAWAAFVVSAPSAGSSSRPATQYLQEPGLVDQRGGERGVDAASAPDRSVLTPELQEHRRLEREESAKRASG